MQTKINIFEGENISKTVTLQHQEKKPYQVFNLIKTHNKGLTVDDQTDR